MPSPSSAAILTATVILPYLARLLLKQAFACVTRPFKNTLRRCFGGQGAALASVTIHSQSRATFDAARAGRDVISSFTIPSQQAGCSIPWPWITGTFIPQGSVLIPLELDQPIIDIAETVVTVKAHTLETGDKVTFRSDRHILADGGTRQMAEQVFYVRKLDDNRLELYDCLANAQSLHAHHSGRPSFLHSGRQRFTVSEFADPGSFGQLILPLSGDQDLWRATRVAWYFRGPAKAAHLHLQSWTVGRDMLGLSSCSMVLIAVCRLILWHLIQPAFYVLAFFAYYEDLDPIQRQLGWAVFGREVGYVCVCLAGLVLHPMFLLFDPVPTAHDGRIWYSRVTSSQELTLVGPESTRIDSIMLFVLAPEKFVAVCIAFGRWPPMSHPYGHKISQYCVGCLNFLFFLCDLCAVVALFAGMRHRTVFLPLAIGYSVPMLSGFVFLIAGLVAVLRRVRRGRSSSLHLNTLGSQTMILSVDIEEVCESYPGA